MTEPAEATGRDPQIAEAVDIDLVEPGAALNITVINGENGLEVIAAEPETGAHSGH